MKRLQIIIVIAFNLVAIMDAQEVSIHSAEVQSGKCEVEINIRNLTSSDIFIPALSDKQSEPNYYFVLDQKRKEIQIKRMLFQYPHSITDMIEPCYTFTKIGPGKLYKEKLTLDYPLAVNIFPIDARIDISKFDFVIVDFGILPAETAINEIELSRPFGHCAMADDQIPAGRYKGNRLIDIQNVLSAGPVKLSKEF